MKGSARSKRPRARNSIREHGAKFHARPARAFCAGLNRLVPRARLTNRLGEPCKAADAPQDDLLPPQRKRAVNAPG